MCGVWLVSVEPIPGIVAGEAGVAEGLVYDPWGRAGPVDQK